MTQDIPLQSCRTASELGLGTRMSFLIHFGRWNLLWCSLGRSTYCWQEVKLSNDTFNLHSKAELFHSNTSCFSQGFSVRGNNISIHANCPISHKPKVNQSSLVTFKEGGSGRIAENLPVRRTVTVVFGSNLVLRLIAVCAIGDGAEEDLLVAVWSRRANGESILAVAVDSVCLTCVNLPLEWVLIVGLVWRWYSRHDDGRCQKAKEWELHCCGW